VWDLNFCRLDTHTKFFIQKRPTDCLLNAVHSCPHSHASCVRVDMTAPKPKPKPRGGQRRPFARQHSSSKDVSRKRFEQQLEDDM